MKNYSLFRSFFLGGFECSTHRIACGKRLDVIAATAHDRFAHEDYVRLREQNIGAAREGLRWHLIEKRAREYDFSSALPLLKAARRTKTQIVWDLCHYGFPDDIDLFKPEFVNRFAAFARAFARFVRDETDERELFFSPVNEISFFTWAAGEVGGFYPFAAHRGDELKRQLVRAAIVGIEAVWDVLPQARAVHTDPVVNVVADAAQNLHNHHCAEYYRSLQFEAWDMLAGNSAPELGGKAEYLDIVGVNFYAHNQWCVGDSSSAEFTLLREHGQYKPFRQILTEIYERYKRPVFVAETGAENNLRAGWFRYACEETRAAMLAGVPVAGICLYPIVNHPGWDDDRHCRNGLWDYPNEQGEREIYHPLKNELRRQQQIFERLLAPRTENRIEFRSPERLAA